METSPLLRLPAEIRDCIYTLVLGGNDIHVGKVDNIMSYSVCTETTSHREVTRLIKSQGLEQTRLPSWFDHVECATHGSAIRSASVRIGLQLLLVCRQIYKEAEALPFKTNTFILHSPLELQQFANSLQQKQRVAVASVGLITSFITPHGSAHLGRRFSAGPGTLRLSGLDCLIIVLGIPSKTTPAEVGELLNDAEESFGRRSLFSVDILIRLRTHTRSSASDLALSTRQYAEWARETELALLKPSDDQ